MTLTGRQLRDALEVLRWDRFELQRRTALSPVIVDQAMASSEGIGGTLAEEIIIKEALHRAGIVFTADSVRLTKDGT